MRITLTNKNGHEYLKFDGEKWLIIEEGYEDEDAETADHYDIKGNPYILIRKLNRIGEDRERTAEILAKRKDDIGKLFQEYEKRRSKLYSRTLLGEGEDLNMLSSWRDLLYFDVQDDGKYSVEVCNYSESDEVYSDDNECTLIF